MRIACACRISVVNIPCAHHLRLMKFCCGHVGSVFEQEPSLVRNVKGLSIRCASASLLTLEGGGTKSAPPRKEEEDKRRAHSG